MTEQELLPSHEEVRGHWLIGAGISGIDLGRIDDDAFRRIYEAGLGHLLLVFLEQGGTEEEQIAPEAPGDLPRL